MLIVCASDRGHLPGCAQACRGEDGGEGHPLHHVLSSPASRAAYDASRAEAQAKGGPRPAQVVSLEEFAESGDEAGRMTWTFSCRCGGMYIVREEQLEDGQHLVGCNSCSEVVWVGFEVADEVEDEES